MAYTPLTSAFEPRFASWLERDAPIWTAPLKTTFLDLALWQWIGLVLAGAASAAAGFVVSHVLLRTFGVLAAKSRVKWDELLIRNLRQPLGGLVTLLVLRALTPALGLGAEARNVVGKVLVVAFIATLTWLATCAVRFLTDAIESHAGHQHRGEGSREARLLGLKTQLLVLRRVAVVLVAVTGGALVLLQFEPVRNIGVSMLASAGVAGIVVGLAAQKPVGALLAGLQMSITQPIRIGDKVLVQDKEGTIEEINLSHVVVKLWDERRLIVPTTYFLDNAFENWTRTSPELLGGVNLYAEFTLPADEVRAALNEVLAESPLWDRRVAKVEVTDVDDRVMKLRVVVSAADPEALDDLVLFVRERLVAWLREFDAGRHLPQSRLEASAESEDRKSVAPVVSGRARRRRVAPSLTRSNGH
jgi:small-conductance mechanosensitive channel